MSNEQQMREALRLADAALSGANMNMAVVKRKIAEALAQPEQPTSYVQTVPDHCDRIVWRNSYYHLPLKQPERRGEIEDAERRAVLWEKLHDKRVERIRELDAEIARLTVPPSPAVPDGWKLAACRPAFETCESQCKCGVCGTTFGAAPEVPRG